MADEETDKLPDAGATAKISRAALQIAGGAIPFAGGIVSAIAGAWSEREQERINKTLEHWIQMLREELKEKEETIIEIMERIDVNDEEISKRVDSKEYKSILKKSFREWAGSESEEKRVLIRNILANAATTRIVDDDVVRMFLDWIRNFSILHFSVIGAVYNSNGITRGQIWRKIGKSPCREDSAEADLFKLLIRDLSMGGIIRQHRETDYYGNFMPKERDKRPKGSGPKPAISAFDEDETYELTGLGKQFIHYAMTDLPLKISFSSEESQSTQ